MLGRTGGVQETQGVDAHIGAPAMRTGCPAYPLARQRLAAPPRGRPGRGSRLGLDGERPRGHRCPDRARGRARFHTLGPAPFRGRSPSNHPCRKAVPRRFEAAEHPFAHRLVGGLCGIADHGRDGTGRGSPFNLPAWDRWYGSDPTGRAGWPCTSHPSPCRVRYAEHMGRSRQRANAPARHRPPRRLRHKHNDASSLRYRRRVTPERGFRAQRP